MFLFFVLSWLVSELIAWRFRLGRPQQVLLAMTTAARNSPFALGLATIALPDQPLVYAALIIGMLAEFPHLQSFPCLMLRQQQNLSTSAASPRDHKLDLIPVLSHCHPFLYSVISTNCHAQYCITLSATSELDHSSNFQYAF